MPTLSEFLLARIADEENLARDAASEGTPHRTGWQLWTSKIETTAGGEVLGPRGSIEASPARVLAECEAKRRIVRRYLDTVFENWAEPDHEYENWILPELALPYADHPDYQEEWRP